MGALNPLVLLLMAVAPVGALSPWALLLLLMEARVGTLNPWGLLLLLLLLLMAAWTGRTADSELEVDMAELHLVVRCSSSPSVTPLP